MVLMNNYDDTWSDVEVNAVVAFYSGKQLWRQEIERQALEDNGDDDDDDGDQGDNDELEDDVDEG